MHERRLKWKTWEDFTYLRTYNLEGAIEEFRNFDANLFLNQIYLKLEKWYFVTKIVLTYVLF